VAGSLPWVLAGSLLMGAGTTAVLLGRYAAADLAAEANRARAMGSVLSATTVGAVAGPNLLAPAAVVSGLLGLPELAGVYAIGGALFICATALLARLPLPADERDVRRNPSDEGDSRRKLSSSGKLGLAVLAVSNLVMVAVMTMAPVHLHHHGVGLGMIGFVISLHIAGMFGPAPLSGWLTDRVGGRAAALVAGVLLAGSGALAAAGAGSVPVLAVALVLLGIGWNVGLIAGSALLTADVPASERPRREGWGEVGMGVTAAGGGAVSGLLVGAGGYALLAVTGAVIAAGLIPLALRFTRWRSGQQRVLEPSPPPPHDPSVAR
jgi:MFS family permease